MARSKRKKKSGFRIFMTVYVILFLMIAAGGLYFLWNYIAAYERSLPNSTVSEFESDGLQDAFLKYVSDYAVDHTNAFQDAEDVKAYLLQNIVPSELKLRKDSAASPDGTPVYQVRYEKEMIGRVFLRKAGDSTYSLGMQELAIDHTEWELPERFLKEYSIVAPRGTELAANGALLTKGNCKVGQTEYIIGSLADGLDPVFLDTYSFSYFGEPVITVENLEPDTFTITRGTSNDYQVSIVSDPNLSIQLEPFAKTFVTDYIRYTSHAGSYYTALQHTIPGSALYQRIIGSLDGMNWVSGVTSTISELCIDGFEVYGDAVICEAHYNLTDTMNGVMEANMRLLLVRWNNNWKVYNIEMF